MQGFRKVDPDAWEFANKYFVKSKRSALVSIQRRKVANSSINQQALEDTSVHSPKKSSKLPHAADKEGIAWYGSMHDYSGALHAAANLLAFSNKAVAQAAHLSCNSPSSPVADRAHASAYVAPPFPNCMLPQFLPLNLRARQLASQQPGQEAPVEQQHQQAYDEGAATWPLSSPRLVVGAAPDNQADCCVKTQGFGAAMLVLQKPSRSVEDVVHLGHARFLSSTASKGAAPMPSLQTAAGAVHSHIAVTSSGLGSLRDAGQLDGHPVRRQRTDGAGEAKQHQARHWPIPLLPLGSHQHTAPHGMDCHAVAHALALAFAFALAHSLATCAGVYSEPNDRQNHQAEQCN